MIKSRDGLHCAVGGVNNLELGQAFVKYQQLVVIVRQHNAMRTRKTVPFRLAISGHIRNVLDRNRSAACQVGNADLAVALDSGVDEFSVRAGGDALCRPGKLNLTRIARCRAVDAADLGGLRFLDVVDEVDVVVAAVVLDRSAVGTGNHDLWRRRREDSYSLHRDARARELILFRIYDDDVAGAGEINSDKRTLLKTTSWSCAAVSAAASRLADDQQPNAR